MRSRTWVIRIDGNDLANGTGYATLLRTGTPISARTAQRMACDAEISVWGTINGEEGLTDSTRLFVGKTRRLLELRDRGCAFPGCDRPPSWCEGHHIIAWLQGGPTTLDNGVLLCGYHHRLIHQDTWTVHMAADGQPEFTPPEWISKPENPYATPDSAHREASMVHVDSGDPRIGFRSALSVPDPPPGSQQSHPEVTRT